MDERYERALLDAQDQVQEMKEHGCLDNNRDPDPVRERSEGGIT